jgi:hypothetical protein
MAPAKISEAEAEYLSTITAIGFFQICLALTSPHGSYAAGAIFDL